MKLILFEVVNLKDDVKTFVFSSNEIVNWIPGQFLHITLNHPDEDDRGHERWFTISSAPSEGKIAINALNQGDEIEADHPDGDFIIQGPDANYIFVAGGIGITPFRSIIKHASLNKIMPNITLLYANRTVEVAFQNELDDIQLAYSNLKIRYVFSPAKIDKALLSQTIESNDNPLIYVSGPEPMVESFDKILKDIGLDSKNIKTDFFPGYQAF